MDPFLAVAGVTEVVVAVIVVVRAAVAHSADHVARQWGLA